AERNGQEDQDRQVLREVDHLSLWVTRRLEICSASRPWVRILQGRVPANYRGGAGLSPRGSRSGPVCGFTRVAAGPRSALPRDCLGPQASLGNTHPPRSCKRPALPMPTFSEADPIVILSYARTPMGGMQGALAEVSATDLGATAVKAAVERAGIEGDQIDRVYMGCVLPAGLGQAPARPAALKAGLPKSVQ